MKEIGEFLKTSRINNGVSIEEAADDLNLSVTQLENIEEGNIKAFKDLYVLKDLVKDYGKYLGVQTDSILDEFNDFMFQHTSKISLDDILEARRLAKEKENDEKPKIVSPYTVIRKPKFSFENIKLKPLLVSIVIILIIFISVFVWFRVNNKKENISTELKGRSVNAVYEFTY